MSKLIAANPLLDLFYGFTGMPIGHVGRSIDGDLRVEFVDMHTYPDTGLVHYVDFDIAFLWDDREKMENVVDVRRVGLDPDDPSAVKVATELLLEAIETKEVTLCDLIVQKPSAYRDNRTPEQRKRFLQRLGVTDLPLSTIAA